MTTWIYDDGGRAAAGYRGETGDCAVRAVAIAAQLPYADAYRQVAAALDHWTATSRSRAARIAAQRSRKPSPRDGVHADVLHKLLGAMGWTWKPTMQIGAGTTVHLDGAALPAGRLIARCSRHFVAVIDGVIHDTHDPTRDGSRAVYGYWQPPPNDTDRDHPRDDHDVVVK